MTFQFYERPTSRSGTRENVTLKYIANGLDDDASVRMYTYAATPSIFVAGASILYRQNKDITIDAQAASLYYVDVPYGPDNTEVGAPPDIGFDTTGGTVHITSSKYPTVNSYKVGGGAAPDCKQAIGVHGVDVDGVDIYIPALKLDIELQHAPGAVNLSKVKELARSTAIVNSSPFLTFDAGEVLFLGCSGRVKIGVPTAVRYNFACSENADDLSIGAIANVAKKGHDYLWISYKDEVDANNPVKQPQFAYVERVYRYADLRAILGFG